MSDPTTVSATILPFDFSRVRPGLRDRMLDARRFLDISEGQGTWIEGDITPDMIRNFLGSRDTLFAIDDSTVAQRAERGAILALEAVQSGIWSEHRALRLFMALQAQAVGMTQRHDSSYCKNLTESR